MPPSFDGIKEKLKRSHENVLNLQAEVQRFFEESTYPVLPQDNVKLLVEAIKYHSQREIPLRFSVLAGEIAHHLRSCLDHIVWQFSTDAYRIAHPQRIEFPILETRPTDKDAIKRFERKIEGITNSDVLSLIETLQPYNSSNPVESAIMVIHNMNVFDKHRELVLCLSTGAIEVPHEIVGNVIAKLRASQQQGIVDATFEAELQRDIENHAQITATISFANFRGREFEAIIPAMMELNNEVVRIVARFDSYLPR